MFDEPKSNKKIFCKVPSHWANLRKRQTSLINPPCWSNFSESEKAVLPVIFSHANRGGSCFLRRDTIEQESGLKGLDNVSRAISSLVEKEIITRAFRFTKSGESKSSLFTVLVWENIPFGMIPANLVKLGVWAAMTFPEKSLYIALASILEGSNWCRLTRADLRKYTGIKHKATLAKAVTGLYESGLILEEKEFSKNGNPLMFSRYSLTEWSFQIGLPTENLEEARRENIDLDLENLG